MKKTWIYCVLGLLILIGWQSCNNKDGCKRTHDTDSIVAEPEVPDISDETVVAPKVLKVFIDGSGSMKGYFGKEDISNIADALAGLNKAVESREAEYYVWGKNTELIPSDELTARLIDKNLQGKATSFDRIFSEMAKMAGKDTLTVLISDGIISSHPEDTKKDEDFTYYDKGQLTNLIEKSLKGKGKVMSIYRMKGNFNGEYLNKANSKVNYKGDRPFFVFVLGSPANVRDFDSKVRTGVIPEIYQNAEKIYIGAAPAIDCSIGVSGEAGESIASSENFTHDVNDKVWRYTGEEGFKVVVTTPEWLMIWYPEEVIKRMSKIEVGGNILPAEIYVEDNGLSFLIPEKIVQKLQEKNKVWSVKFTLNDPALKDWKRFSTSDDTEPDSEHTYLLYELIKAIHDGITGGKSYLFETEMIIDPTETN